ncbi:MAG: antibiotic biosynthesis monooxygenase [Chloroflexi bacterium]|nr:antibiotic biosynthesis monooxygenase [Chloroflexota bacterium]MYD65147.1 antibiotic biosynthesis monooxygenase [Chloroflexota bacterium]
MFIAMNRFQIAEGREEEFERSWRERDSYLDEVPGFQHFALLKGDNPGEYISHSTWESRDAFVAWTQSDVFRKAHGQPLAGGVMQDAPHVSLYEAILVTPGDSTD